MPKKGGTNIVSRVGATGFEPVSQVSDELLVVFRQSFTIKLCPQKGAVLRDDRKPFELLLGSILAPKGEVGNLLDVGTSNLAVLAKVS